MVAYLLPNGEQQFCDINGEPYASGTVTHYIPSTTTLKDTWQDQAQTTLNQNPLTLDAAGRAIIWGSGSYRQVLKDADGNTIWDRVTSSPEIDTSNLYGTGYYGGFTATGGETSFLLVNQDGNSFTVAADAEFTLGLYINGVKQQLQNYTTNGTDLVTLVSITLAAGDLVYYEQVGGTSSSIPVDGSVTAAKIVTSDSGRWAITQILRFLQAGTGAVYRWVSDKLRERVSPEDFGAVGDGVTDDYAALMRAFTYASSVRGVVVSTPGNDYAIGTGLVWSPGWSIGWIGAGNQSRLIPLVDGMVMLTLGNYNYTGTNNYNSSYEINKCFVENLCMDVSDAAKTAVDGLELRGSNKGRFDIQTYGCRVGCRVLAISNYNVIKVFSDGPNCLHIVDVDGAGFDASYNSTENIYTLIGPFVNTAGMYCHGTAFGDIVVESMNFYGNAAVAGFLFDGTGSAYSNNIKIGPCHIDGSATYGIRGISVNGISYCGLLGGGAIGTDISLVTSTGQTIYNYLGGSLLGNATGSFQGDGTINVSGGYYVNGSAVPVVTPVGADRVLNVTSATGNASVELLASGAVLADFTTDRATGAARLRNRSAAPLQLYANDTQYVSISSSGVITLVNSAVFSSPAFSGTSTGTYTLGGTLTIASPTLSGTVTGPHTGDIWNSTGLGIGITPIVAFDVKTGTNQVLRARGPITLGTGVSWNAENDAGSANVNVEFRGGSILLLTGTSLQMNGTVKFATGGTTGAGSALLGANCPAVTVAAPYQWQTVTTNDGSTGYIPIWK